MPDLDWLVPQPSLAALAQLQHNLATVRKCTDMAGLMSLTESLLRQNMLYGTLIKQATHRIAQLERDEFLAGKSL